MKRIVLISCVSEKLPCKAKAKDLYISSLFRYSLKYAKLLNPNKIFILSAKYGLLNLDDEIEPYNETLSNISKKQIEKNPNVKVLSKKEREEWAKTVIKKLGEKCDLNSDEIIFLAGKRYSENLIPYIKNDKDILKGKRIGERIGFLKEECSDE
ncbi:MAG: DUF6884 domain-containing protein [Candidatus Methanoperedens sp.]